MTLASLTLVPAILTILGAKSFWPFIPKKSSNTRAEEGMLYGRIGKIVLKKPIFTLVATIITLGVMIFGVFGSQKSFDQLDSLPKDTESVRSFELLREGFSPGRLSPTNIFIENENQSQ